MEYRILLGNQKVLVLCDESGQAQLVRHQAGGRYKVRLV